MVHTSGLHWYELLLIVSMRWVLPSKAEEHYIWLYPNGNKYKYIAVYHIYDLAIAAEDPRMIFDILINHYNFELKGTDPIAIYLGIDFFCDECGILCMTPRTYMEKMGDTFE